MKRFDLQGIELAVSSARAFDYIADPAHLPAWTQAFATVDGSQATMRTPAGEIRVDLLVRADAKCGTVDWKLSFPDGSTATAFSRVVPLEEARCLYSFVLTPPPVPLAELEGTLEQQSRILAEELQVLKRILENGAR